MADMPEDFLQEMGCTQHDEADLKHSGETLGLAKSESIIGIRLSRCKADRDKAGDGTKHIERGMHKRGQYADTTRLAPKPEFANCHDEAQPDRQGGNTPRDNRGMVRRQASGPTTPVRLIEPIIRSGL